VIADVGETVVIDIWLQRIYSVPDRGTEYCDEFMSLAVLCLSTSISQKPHAQSSLSFLSILPVAIAKSSSGSIAILIFFRFELPVLWKTSCP